MSTAPGPSHIAATNAIRRYEERLAREPSSLAFAQLADAYLKAGRPRDAMTTCREGLCRYPQYTTVRLILAKALAAEGEVEAALTELETILSTLPSDAQSHRLAAELRRRQGDVDGAVRHLEAVVAAEPDDRESRALLGLLRPSGQTADGAGVHRLLRDDTFVNVRFARLCLDQGLADEAAQVFSRLLRTNPSDHEAREGLEGALNVRARRRG